MSFKVIIKMFCINYFLAAIICYLIAESNAGVVNFIKKCKVEDKACIKSSGQAALPHFIPGIPELGVPVMDPITLDDLRIDENNFKLGYKNTTVAGVGKCQIVELERDTTKSTIELTAECPIDAKGQYDLNGKLLFIEAFGEGDFHIYTDKVRVMVEVKIKYIEKDGNKHWKVTGFDYEYDLPERVHIELTNLFNGNQERAKPILEIFENEESSKELVKSIGDPIIKEFISKYVIIFKDFFLVVPSTELEIES